MNQQRRLFLASSSPRRVEMLEKMGVSFSVIPNLCIDEVNPSSCKDLNELRSIVLYNCHLKASLSQSNYEGLIMSSDTLVYFPNHILATPQSRIEAETMLKTLSNQRHYVCSGVCIIDTATQDIFKIENVTEVIFNPLSNSDIDMYINSGSPFDKAGGYGIQDVPDSFIQTVKGEIETVIGLPYEKVYQFLSEYDIVK